MSLEPEHFKSPESAVGFLALLSMLWQQLMCSRTDKRSETEDLSELRPAKPPFKLDEDYQSPGLFDVASMSWKRVLQPRTLCYSPSCTQLWESSFYPQFFLLPVNVTLWLSWSLFFFQQDLNLDCTRAASWMMWVFSWAVCLKPGRGNSTAVCWAWCKFERKGSAFVTWLLTLDCSLHFCLSLLSSISAQV